MATVQPQQQSNQQRGDSRGYKRFLERRLVIVLAIFLFVMGILIGVLNILGFIHAPWSNILSIFLFPIFGVTIPFFVWLFSTSSSKSKRSLSQSMLQLPLSTNTNSHEGKIGNLSSNEGTKLEEMHVQFDSFFLFNVPLTAPGEFYGRVRERATLISRARKGASTSIVGQRRIGKTWLIDYLRLIVQTEFGSSFHICYVDATLPSCATIAGFTAKVLEGLGVSPKSNNINLDLTALEKVVKDLNLRNRTPVVCIDEFESIVDRQGFDMNFFTDLRAIAQSGLALIVTSRSPLIDIVSDNVKTSPLFNIFEQITLQPFNINEAEAFAQAKGVQSGFNDQECSLLLKYGQQGDNQWPPARLQLVGKTLLEDKILALKESSNYYRPDDTNYWQEFEARLEETYRGIAR
jgi:hypothetical protein